MSFNCLITSFESLAYQRDYQNLIFPLKIKNKAKQVMHCYKQNFLTVKHILLECKVFKVIKTFYGFYV